MDRPPDDEELASSFTLFAPPSRSSPPPTYFDKPKISGLAYGHLRALLGPGFLCLVLATSLSPTEPGNDVTKIRGELIDGTVYSRLTVTDPTPSAFTPLPRPSPHHSVLFSMRCVFFLVSLFFDIFCSTPIFSGDSRKIRRTNVG